MISDTMVGAIVEATAQQLAAAHEQIMPFQALYCEKRGGFQCRTCTYATAANATHGHCAIVKGTIHLDEGCCVMWAPDTAQLHAYKTL